MAYQSYKDLDIYKKAHKLAIEIYEITLKDLPNFEMYEEASQIKHNEHRGSGNEDRVSSFEDRESDSEFNYRSSVKICR